MDLMYFILLFFFCFSIYCLKELLKFKKSDFEEFENKISNNSSKSILEMYYSNTKY